MARRWYIPLLALPVAVGTVVAVLEGVASASPGLTQAATRTAAVQRLFPGAPVISPSGGAVPSVGHGVLNLNASTFNWAGYAVEGRRGAFRSVSAAWTEPRVNCRGVRGRRFSALWAGLDGFSLPNQPTDNSVEQLGTDSDCHGTTPVYYAWWEMFPAVSVNLPNPVHPGDHMSASVTFSGAGRYALFIRDSTRRWSRTIVRVQGGLNRSSAEIIAEAPELDINNSAVLQPLANFGPVHWTGSRANGTLLENLAQRIRITMVSVNPPHRIKATTSGVSPLDVFTNTWVRAS
jgi:hypothetical protein